MVAEGSATPSGDGKSAKQPKKKSSPQAAPDASLNLELGVERILPFSGWASNNEILNNNPIPLDDLVEMRRRDGQARALVRIFTLAILSAMADGQWNAPEGDDSADEEVQFANDMWNLPPQAGGMTTSKSRILKKTLLGLTDGFACFEEVRHVPDEGPLAGKITLRKLAYRDPRTIRFRVDDRGGFAGVRQIANLAGKTIDVVIPKDKVWYWSCNEEENPYYGISMFESAWYHYDIKKKLYYIAHLAAQFAAVPGRIGTIPKSADPRTLQAFKQSLMNFAFNTAMVAPEGYKVEPFNGNNGFDFIKLIDHHNHMMSKSVLAAFLDQDQRAALVEVNSAADPNSDFFVLALESLMDDIAESWSTYLMPKYIDWNFGTKKYPVFKFGQLSDAAKETIKELFTSMVTSSVLNSTPEFVRELEKKLSKSLDLDIDYDAIEKQEKQAAEDAAKKAEDEANGLLNPADPNAPQQPGQDGQQPPGQQAPPDGSAPHHDITDPSQIALTNPTIDDIVSAAQALLMERPDMDDEGED